MADSDELRRLTPLLGMVKDAGFWAGMTLYPESKLNSHRAIDIIETWGADRIWMNCACDWGVSDPLATPKAAQAMRARGHDPATIQQMVWDNPHAFMSQSPKFRAE